MLPTKFIRSTSSALFLRISSRCSSTFVAVEPVKVPIEILGNPNDQYLKSVMESINLEMKIKAAHQVQKTAPAKKAERVFDVVQYPTEKHLESFMQGIGKKRTAFKPSDHLIWKNSFKEDYKMLFICPEGTSEVIGCMKFIYQRALSSHQNQDCLLVGDLYVEDEYRGKEILKIMTECVLEEAENVGNTVWSAMKTSEAFTRKVFPRSRSDFDCYQSLYKRENVKISNLEFDDIVVKSANDVADHIITNYDQSIYPFERREYILSVLRDADGFGKVAFDQDGNVIGFGTTTIYPSGNCTLFPMYGDNERVVQAIFQECLKDIEKSGKNVTTFDLRTAEAEGFDRLSWMKPFLTHEPESKYLAKYFYSDEMPTGLDMKKVFVIASPSVCSI